LQSFTATATDNCANVGLGTPVIVYSLSPTMVPLITFPYAFPLGTTKVYALATDRSGLTDQCDFDVVVVDNQPPVAAGPFYVDPVPFHDGCYVNAEASVPAFDVAKAIFGYEDNCSVTATLTATLVAPPTADDCGWSVTYVYTIKDGNPANDLTGQTYIHYGKDMTIPTGTPPTPITGTNSCVAGAYTAAPFNATLAAAGYTDNCGAAVTAVKTGESITGNDCGWTITYTFSVLDACGNSATGQTYTHSGSDQTAPTGTQPADITNQNACYATALGLNPFDAAHATSTYTDNCGASVSAVKTGESITGGDCGWEITYTYNVVDACGNSYTDAFTKYWVVIRLLQLAHSLQISPTRMHVLPQHLV
jgi:hypothetical protein